MNTTTTTADDFRSLAMAALKLGTRMLASLEPEQQRAVDVALQAGARLSLDFEGLLTCDAAHLMLIEREGRRTRLYSVRTNPAAVAQM